LSAQERAYGHELSESSAIPHHLLLIAGNVPGIAAIKALHTLHVVLH